MKWARHIMLGASLLVAWPCIGHTREALEVTVQAGAEEPARALDPIEITVMIATPVDPTRSLPPREVGVAEIEPGGTDNVVSILEVWITAAGTLVGDYNDRGTCLFQQQGMRSGQALPVHCILHPKDESIRGKLLPSLSAVFARSIIVQAHVRYMQDDLDHETSAVKRLAVVPPLMSVFFGGMTGAFMLALFRGLVPFHRSSLAVRRGGTVARSALLGALYDYGFGLARFIAITFAWLVLGGVCAIMIIILSQVSTGELSPIKIEVKDFAGGVLVGLLSFPVVTWLEKRLATFDRSVDEAVRQAK